MGILGDYTPQQIKDADVTVIRTKFKQKIDLMNKKQLIILYLKGNDLDIENMEIQDREEGKDEPSKGQIWRLRVFRDVLGNITRKQRIDWTYKPPQPDGNCSVDTITIKEMDANDNVISTKVNKQ